MKNVTQILMSVVLLFGAVFLNAQTTIIDPAGDGGFETGADFSANGWSVVNGGPLNRWVCSTGATAGFSGVRCGYVSNNDAGAPPPHTYTNNQSSTVHLYRDVTFPSGETVITFSFNIRMEGEFNFDRLLVYISNSTPSGTPVAGTPASNSTSLTGYTLLSTEAIASSWIFRSVLITSAQAGNSVSSSSRRLLLVWQNDISLGSNPPVAIDNISLTSQAPPPPPPNDDCASATTLTVGSGFPCTPGNPLSWTGATASSGAPAPSCGSYSTGDIWYTFTLASSQTVMVNTAPGTGTTPITDGAMTLYSGACGALVDVECDDDDGAGNMPQIRKYLTAGTYYIRFWDYADKTTTDFGGICVTTVTPLANDNCSGVNGTPIVLTPQPFAAACSSPTSATTVGATQSNTDCSPIGTFAADDVWFQFTTGAVITSQTIRFQNVSTVFGGSVTSMAVNLYAGSCAGASSNCTTCALSFGEGSVTLSGLTANTTYYLRVWTNSDTDNGATFDICIIDPQPMTYVSSAIVQQTGVSSVPSTYQKILRLAVTVINIISPLSVTQLNFSTAGTPGTSNVSDLTNARVYYTGIMSTFTDGAAAGTQFGSTIANPNGAMVFTGSQALTGGVANTTNYFWLVYDLPCSASGPNIDASMSTNGLTIGATSYTPTTPDPAGNRTVTAIASYSTVANGNWSNPATWSCAVPPSGTTSAVNINHNVTLDVDATINASVTIAAAKTLTINANTLNIGTAGSGTQSLLLNGVLAMGGGTLNVGTSAGVTNSTITVASGGTLTLSNGTINLGPSGGYNRSLSVTGTTTISGGTLNVNGNAVFNSNSTFNMSGGNFNIDGNGAAVVPTSTNLLRFGASSTGMTINATAGTITIVDPHANSSTTDYAVGISILSSNAQPTSFASCTFQFGDGVSATSGNTFGFIFDTYISTKNVPLGNVVVNGGNGSTRFTSGTASSINASDINGTLTVNSGSEIRTSGSAGFGVYGNIVNEGTISVTSASSGVLYLGGSQLGSPPAPNAAQIISGLGVWRNSTASSTASINNLTMNNTLGSTLQVPLSIGNTLTLTSGKIFTDASNYIAVGAGLLPAGAVSSGTVSPTTTTNTSHIVGPIRRAVPSGTTWAIGDQRGLFPLGDGTTARQLNIAVTSAATAGSLSGKYSATDPTDPPSSYSDGGISIDKTSPTGFWNVEYANGAAGGAYTVQANATGFTKRPSGAITLFSSIRLIKRSTGGSWVAGADGTATAPAGLSAVSRSGCTTFSDFAIGGTFLALPLELKSFTGKTLPPSNLLQWETLTEKNVQWHLVERSLDGVKWLETGRKAGQMESFIPVKYELEDRLPLAKAYYRLRSVDFDGTENLSNTILLTRKGEQFGITAAFPSPTKDMITVQFVSLQEETVTIRVVDFTGRFVLEQEFAAYDGINEAPVQLAGLQAGAYLVRISNARSTAEPLRIVKE